MPEKRWQTVLSSIFGETQAVTGFIWPTLEGNSIHATQQPETHNHQWRFDLSVVQRASTLPQTGDKRSNIWINSVPGNQQCCKVHQSVNSSRIDGKGKFRDAAGMQRVNRRCWNDTYFTANVCKWLSQQSRQQGPLLRRTRRFFSSGLRDHRQYSCISPTHAEWAWMGGWILGGTPQRWSPILALGYKLGLT